MLRDRVRVRVRINCFDCLSHSYLNLVYSEVAWALVFSGTQVQPQIILDPNYHPEYLYVSYDYAENEIK